jgi:hypothetical protein
MTAHNEVECPHCEETTITKIWDGDPKYCSHCGNELESTVETEQCIRCNNRVPVGTGQFDQYVPLTFNQETGALPLCRDCFHEVRGRDLWLSP